MNGPTDRGARIARNEAVFRETNEQISVINEIGAQLPEIPILCECGSAGCAEVVRVGQDLYESVRSSSNRFLLRAGHEEADVEIVVERHADILVVEKKPGRPRLIVEATDPRRHRGDGNGDETDVETARRIAENESQFREANERIERATVMLDPAPATLPFLCECGRLECLVTIRLALEDYELARANPRTFVCARFANSSRIS